MRTLQLTAATSALILSIAAFAQTSLPAEVITLHASEDADGVTQRDFSLDLLKALEKKSVSSLKAKMEAYMKTEGTVGKLPPLKAESHYMEYGSGFKLAVIKITSPNAINQLHIFGIKEKELHRIICTKSKEFNTPIPISYGSCGSKIASIFGPMLR